MTRQRRYRRLSSRVILGGRGIRISIGNKTVQLTRAELTSIATGRQRRERFEELTGIRMRDLFIHKNRDGSFAFATGQRPTVWPEDEVQL